MNNKHRSFLAVLLLVFSVASAGESNGPVSTIWDSTFQLRVGVFFPDLDSHIRIDSSFERIGDGIDFEQDLGMSESKTTFYGGASWQFANKHILEWEFFDLGRDGLTTTEDRGRSGTPRYLRMARLSQHSMCGLTGLLTGIDFSKTQEQI